MTVNINGMKITASKEVLNTISTWAFNSYEAHRKNNLNAIAEMDRIAANAIYDALAEAGYYNRTR